MNTSEQGSHKVRVGGIMNLAEEPGPLPKPVILDSCAKLG